MARACPRPTMRPGLAVSERPRSFQDNERAKVTLQRVEFRTNAPSRLRIYAMTVSRGREFFSIPGPTNIPDAVLAAMRRPAIDIYAGDVLAVTHSLLEDLPKIFRTSGRTYIYAANGHGGGEAALTNVLSRGETGVARLHAVSRWMRGASTSRWRARRRG